MGCLNCSYFKSRSFGFKRRKNNTDMQVKYQKLEKENFSKNADDSISYSEIISLNLESNDTSPMLEVNEFSEDDIKIKVFTLKDLTSMIAATNIINGHKYGSCEVNWTDSHLQVQHGLNILAVCKNVECKLYLKDILCPKGLYPDENGYCSFDVEIHKVKCPICKQRIRADNSFGFCFYECKFEMSYMLDDDTSDKMKMKASNNKLLFAKCSNNLNGHLQYLDIQFQN